MARVVIKGIQGPDGAVLPADAIVHYATHVPALRREVISALEAGGHLEPLGLRRAPWYRRLFRRNPTPAIQGT